MKKERSIIALFLAMASLNSIGQTTNVGTLHLKENTVVSTLDDFENTGAGDVINNGSILFYKDLTNNGSYNFSSGTSSVSKFVGIDAQYISGSQPCFFYDLEFNNTSSDEQNIFVEDEIVITNQANFIDGIVIPASGISKIYFEQNAYAQNVSNTSFIDGDAEKIGSTDFKFPIGDAGYYRFCQISSPNSATDQFNAEYFLSNPNQFYSISSKENNIEFIDNQEYWIINQTAGASNVIITLSWDELTTPFNFISNVTKMHVVKWDPILLKWLDMGGVANTVDNTVSTVIPLDEFGVFTLALIKDETDVFVFEGFSPNGDGENDALVVDNIENYPNTSLTIFNRWGSQVYTSTDYKNDWKGISESKYNIGGEILPEGTYYYILTLGGESSEPDFGKKIKGYFFINR